MKSERELLVQQERVTREVTELICKWMDERNVTLSELASRLGKTGSYVTQLLDGQYNITIRTISDVFAVLGATINFRTEPLL